MQQRQIERTLRGRRQAGRTGGHPHGGMAVHAQAGGKDPPDRLVVLDQQHRSHPATITTPDPAPRETIAQLLVHQDRKTRPSVVAAERTDTQSVRALPPTIVGATYPAHDDAAAGRPTCPELGPRRVGGDQPCGRWPTR